MKTIFVDCNNQLDQVFARVHRSDDPPIAVNTAPFQSADVAYFIAAGVLALTLVMFMVLVRPRAKQP